MKTLKEIQKQMDKFYQQLESKNLKLLNSLNPSLLKEIRLIMEDLNTEIQQYILEFTKKPTGQKQTIDELCCDVDSNQFKIIKYGYVDQKINGGYIGDEFAGDVYIPISDHKFLKIPYEM